MKNRSNLVTWRDVHNHIFSTARMTIEVPYRWGRNQGLSKPDAYRVARIMAMKKCSFTAAMIQGGFWTDYKVWVKQ